MSRSLWAWTKSCAVGCARRAVAGIRPSQVEAHLGCERPVRTISSITPFIWVVATSMVTLTLSAVALGEVGTPHARPSAGRATQGAPEMYAALRQNSRSSDPSRPGRRSVDHRNARSATLAFGTGYDTPHGSRAVRALQRRLTTLGYQPGPIDGRYGPLTEAAVIRFQATRHLTADGIAGVRTLAAVAAAKPVLYPGEGYRPGGSREVRSLQRHLAAAGFSPGPIDGRYGPSTTRALRRFQIARHLRVDGIAGPQTLDRLARALRRGQHHLRPRQSVGPRRTRPAPRRRTAVPGHASPRPTPTRKPRGNSGGAFPVVWVIVLVGLLLAVLARLLWHLLRADADIPENTPVPVALSEGAAERSASTAEDPDADQREGAAAFRLGLLLAQEGDHVGAEDAFRRADERGHPAAAFNLGMLLVEEGDRAVAKDAFRRAAERGHPDAAFALGALLFREGDRAGAEEAFRWADQHGDGGAACNLGVLLEQRGDLVGAMAAYRRADERGHGVGAYNLGALLEQQGDVLGAKTAYQRADERGDPAGAYHLGVLLEREGDRAAAKDAYRRADQRGHPDGACYLGLLLKDEGDHVGAVRALQRAGERGSAEALRMARAALLELDPDEEAEP